ncbi:alcohol acetyltransferase-domain-containing protein [Lophiotrema nucula]|uniref:Alcohol acetyltransferase-domain-containing protein n=1 Tax=Lophiotrema nucula TaxID=690887 RepID=A0A6A5ZC90_9PLEO|nr:alcohol acetyltransferase-domain-containing protein [Lophiotrema nucula]
MSSINWQGITSTSTVVHLSSVGIPFLIVSLATQSASADLAGAVNSAIARVVAQAPILQVGILGSESKKPVWIHLGRLDLNEHVQYVSLDDSAGSEQAVQDTIESQLDTRFFKLEDRPGWRATVFKHTEVQFIDILFTWNHPHGDGMSGKIFHELLLKTLRTKTPEDSLKSLSDCKLVFSDSSVKFPPATEQLVAMPISPLFLVKALWNDNKPTSVFKTPTNADWAPISSMPYKTRFRVFDVETSVTSNVLAACRHHKTTLTALLHGLTLVSLSSHIDDAKATAFASSTAIDQRRFLPSDHADFPWLEPTKTIANYVSIMDHEFNNMLVGRIRQQIGANKQKHLLSRDLLGNVWSTSARVRREIQRRLDDRLKNDLVGLMKFVPD